jgi:hypothetical protein
MRFLASHNLIFGLRSLPEMKLGGNKTAKIVKIKASLQQFPQPTRTYAGPSFFLGSTIELSPGFQFCTAGSILDQNSYILIKVVKVVKTKRRNSITRHTSAKRHHRDFFQQR